MAPRPSFLEATIGGALASSAAVTCAVALANLQYALMTFAIWFVLGFVANAAVAVSLGLAWHTFAYRHGWHSIHVYWAPAAAVGAIVGGLVLAVPSLLSGQIGDGLFFFALIGIGFGIAWGGLTGGFAWMIRRPDRDAGMTA